MAEAILLWAWAISAGDSVCVPCAWSVHGRNGVERKQPRRFVAYKRPPGSVELIIMIKGWMKISISLKYTQTEAPVGFFQLQD